MSLRACGILAAIALAGLIACVSSAPLGNFVAVLQDRTTSEASVVVYNANGTTLATTSLQWVFQWPLVEVSVDTNTQLIHIITYPASIGNATLYKLPYDLSSWTQEVSSGLSYFDLEFSATRNTFFGIAVSSPYGRQLSRFSSFTAPVQYTGITMLPYMWYVNASTIDANTSTYYGLLNHFPGTAGATSEQKLAVGVYADDNAITTSFLRITPNVSASSVTLPLIRFVSWSAPTSTLFAFGNDVQNTACVLGSLDAASGIFTELLWYSGCTAEPMFASNSTAELHAFVTVTGGTRQLLRIAVASGLAFVTSTTSYEDNTLVSGVARLS